MTGGWHRGWGGKELRGALHHANPNYNFGGMNLTRTMDAIYHDKFTFVISHPSIL